ncbi:low affinity ammonium transporter [Trichomonascus vanleenenianus]|uniref:MFS transporter n=1 Tax=Trichomonascus vanleenenianus TaxID=2268995 RepID=UPI003EC9683B
MTSDHSIKSDIVSECTEGGGSNLIFCDEDYCSQNTPETSTKEVAPDSSGQMPKTIPPMCLTREVTFVSILMCAQMFTQAAVGMANFPLQIIGSTFGDDHDDGRRSWYLAAYSLTVGTFILPAGRLGDMYGHKKFFLIGFSWLALWSLICGLSNYVSTSIFFDVCRGLQGIGPAILMPNSLALLGRTFPEGTRKHMAFALFGACSPGGYILGGLFSALLAQFAHWPWAFYIMAITATVVTVASYFVIPARDEHDEDGKRFDFLGAFTGVAGLIFFNVAWNQAPIIGWSRAYTYVLLIIGMLFFAAFVYIELRVAEQPLVPLTVFNARIGSALAIVVCGWATFGMWIFYLSQILEVLKGDTPILMIAKFSPVTLSGMFASLAVGVLMSRLPISVILLISMIAFCVPSILIATLPLTQVYWAQTFVAILIAPWGMDMNFPAASLLLSASVPRAHQGIAASLVATAVNYSISIGLGIGGTVQRYSVPSAESPQDILRSYRSALYAGIGISCLGIAIASATVLADIIRRKKKN